MLPSFLGWPGTGDSGGDHGGSLLALPEDAGAVVLWGVFLGGMRAELWFCICGVLAPSEQLPQCCSLLSGQAGLGGSGQWLMLFPVFSHSTFVRWGTLASKQHAQIQRIRGHVAAMFWGLPCAQVCRECCFCPRETDVFNSETSLCSSLVLGCAFAGFCHGGGFSNAHPKSV